MQATNTSTNKPKLRIRLFRRQALISIIGLGVASVCYMKFVFDYHLKTTLEKYATNLNGAQVNIGNLHTNFITRSLDIENVQVAHHVNAMKNIVEIDKITLSFSVEPLLRKKLILYGMTVEGIHHGTQRETSGIRQYEPEQAYIPPSLIDRGVSTLYTNIRSELNDNPLRFLGNLATGINVKGKVEGLIDQLQTTQHLKETREQLETAINKWDAKKEVLPSLDQRKALKKKLDDLVAMKKNNRSIAYTPLQEAMDELEKQKSAISIVDDLEKDINNIKLSIAYYEPVIDKDIQFLEQKLDIPQLQRGDLTSLVFGTKFMGYLERVSYWIDQSRRKMPTGATFGHSSMVAQPREPGFLIHYGKNAGNPSFLIDGITLTSQLGADKTLGKVSGNISNFTSDPPILGKPTTMSLNADFPNFGVKGITAELLVDHVGASPKEEFSLKIDSFPLNDWMLSEHPDLKFKVNKAKCSVEFTGNFHEEEVSMQWKMHFDDVNYDVQSRYKQVQEVLQNVLTGINSFDVTGLVTGTFSELKYEASSEFGKQLALGLQREFRHQMTAVEESLRSNIADRTAPAKQALVDRLHENEQTVFEPYFVARRDIQAMQVLADKLK